MSRIKSRVSFSAWLRGGEIEPKNKVIEGSPCGPKKLEDSLGEACETDEECKSGETCGIEKTGVTYGRHLEGCLITLPVAAFRGGADYCPLTGTLLWPAHLFCHFLHRVLG